MHMQLMRCFCARPCCPLASRRALPRAALTAGPPFRWLVGHLPEVFKEGQDDAQASWADAGMPGGHCRGVCGAARGSKGIGRGRHGAVAARHAAPPSHLSLEQERWAEQYGSPFLMWMGALPVVVVSVPDQARYAGVPIRGETLNTCVLHLALKAAAAATLSPHLPRLATPPPPRLATCSKVLARPARHVIYSLHTGEEGKLDSYSIVFTR